MDCCQYVNVFQGCGQIDLPKPEGLAAKWFFIKACSGNTTPGARLPFGAMSAAPYSGGYPTGYGDHWENCFALPRHFPEGKGLLGFTHLQHSGTGAIGYYYNFALLTPCYNNSPIRREPAAEQAEPGCYTCNLEDIQCAVTATQHTAFHRYRFGHAGGYVALDMFANGLTDPGRKPAQITLFEKEISGNTLKAGICSHGIRLYFVFECNGAFEATEKGAVARFEGDTARIKVGLSLRSFDKAEGYLGEAADFEQARTQAHLRWEEALSAIRIEGADDRTKEIFYSNLYHSFIMPADWTGDSFLYEGDRAFCTEFSTLWDMYKTALPLIFMLNKPVGEKIADALLSTGEALGQIPNCLGLSDNYLEPTEQARMLGSYALLTAYRYGVNIDPDRMLRVIETDIFADNKRDFTQQGRCKSHTWTLDMADCCALTAAVARERGNHRLAERLLPLAALWRSCYDEDTGLLNGDSAYYEGTLYNYSFRQMVDMPARIALAGGKERFTALLDRFFGYGAPDTVQPTVPGDSKPVDEGMKLGRFEGFNNESDTEAPYSYIFADRQDKTCEVLRDGMKSMFTTGRGGIPGNNDSGALSSYYVFAALGIFPVAGQDLFCIGSPIVPHSELTLFNGRTLTLEAPNTSEKNIYVRRVLFNGNPVENYRIAASALMQGGTLYFEMSDKP